MSSTCNERSIEIKQFYYIQEDYSTGLEYHIQNVSDSGPLNVTHGNLKKNVFGTKKIVLSTRNFR